MDKLVIAIKYKRWYYPPSHRLIVNVLLNNITFYDFFNLSIKCSFVHLYLQFYYSLDELFWSIRFYVLKKGFYWFRYLVYFDNLHYVSYLHNVCTISYILHFFAPLIEVQYFDDREPLTAVLAHFLCTCAETPWFLLPISNLLSPSLSATSILFL